MQSVIATSKVVLFVFSTSVGCALQKSTLNLRDPEDKINEISSKPSLKPLVYNVLYVSVVQDSCPALNPLINGLELFSDYGQKINLRIYFTVSFDILRSVVCTLFNRDNYVSISNKVFGMQIQNEK